MSNDNRYPFVSVVICSKGRHDLLLQAVESVRQSSYPRDRFEIVVVEEAAEPRPVDGVVYVHLPLKNLGLGYCHNRGVAAAQGEIIAFTDDDVVADREWLEALVSSFDDPNVHGAAGLVRTLRGSALGETEEILGLPGGGLRAFARSRGAVVPTKNLSTCNLAYRRSVFNEFSFLETSFGKFGGDDWFLGKQVSEKYATVFNPRALVFHRPKATIARLVHTYYRRQLTDYLARRDLKNESKMHAVFGKKHQCVIFRAGAGLVIAIAGGLAGIVLLCAAYYLFSLVSIAGLWRYVGNKRSFFLYPFIKGITEIGILKGEVFIIFASGEKFDEILERY
jgi:glycosyltransferase involved in cell wall biosynthesis